MIHSKTDKQNKSFSKKYKISTINRILSFGIKRYGAKIISGEINFLGLFLRDKIAIENIDRISYEARRIGRGCPYFYIITEKSGKEHLLLNVFLDKETFIELIKDLLILNNEIKISNFIDELLSAKIVKKKLKLKFDFTVNKKEIFNGKEFSQKHPVLYFAIPFVTLSLIFLIMSIFGRFGEHFLIEKLGIHYPPYRIIAILISGLALGFAIINLLSSLFSEYLGHRVTIILLAITVIGFCIGVL